MLIARVVELCGHLGYLHSETHLFGNMFRNLFPFGLLFKVRIPINANKYVLKYMFKNIVMGDKLKKILMIIVEDIVENKFQLQHLGPQHL